VVARGFKLEVTGVVFRPVQPTRLSDRVVDQIRDAILHGELRPGDRLPSERELAGQFGISRVAVRDALRTLEASGLVRVKAGGGGGTSVAMPDVGLLSNAVGNHLKLIGTEFRELAEARLALETTAARLACERATDADLESLRLAIGARGEEQPARQSATTSVDFHTTLVESAHNRALLAMFNAVRTLMEDAMDLIHTHLPDTAAVAKTVHTELYETIAARDGERAVRIMREHLYDFIERVDRVQAVVPEQLRGSLFL
jgi:GntR family transcriptional repressor for pyruvate dehydrogenase complex